MLDFLFENIFLVGLVIISGILLFFPKIFSKDVKALSAREVTLLINREPTVVIDVRAETDFMNGHITNAINVPLETIEDQVAKFKNLSKYMRVRAFQNRTLSFVVKKELSQIKPLDY